MPDDLESDIQATAEDIAADADVLQAIETEKATIDPTDPRALELAAHADELARGIATKTVVEHELVAEAAQGPTRTPKLEPDADLDLARARGAPDGRSPDGRRGAASIAATMADKAYDYVIVGGGSAGSALGNRLSADPSTRVLVLEAGRSDWRIDPFIHMPAALTFPIGSRFYDWKYESEPEPFMHGRRIYHARGKVLGGSSSINGQIFQRGNPLDFERWAADPGMATWDFAHCLPYFKRMETALAAAPDDPWRGHDGPLVLERGPATNPLFTAFFESVQEAGYPLTEDVNGYRQEGFARVRPEHPSRAAGCRRRGRTCIRSWASARTWRCGRGPS